jgi:hypothetical protein
MRKVKKTAKKTHAKHHAHKWHGVDFHHPIHSLQDSHPAVFVAFLLGLFITYVITFATIADVVGHVI